MSIKDFFFKKYDLNVLPSSARVHGVKTQEELQRIDPSELEAVYRMDDVVFNVVNLRAELCVANGYKIESKSNEVQAEAEVFVKASGDSEMFENQFRHNFLFGRAYLELVPDTRGKIIGLLNRDPKNMDYIKDDNFRIAFDNQQKPKGYMLRIINTGVIPTSAQDRLTTIGSVSGIAFKPEQICHFKYKVVGDELHGLGLVEPIYKVTLNKLNAQEGLGQSIFRLGYPLLFLEVGDDMHEAGMNDVNKATERMKDAHYQSVIGHPKWQRPYIIESKQAIKSVNDILLRWITSQITGLGVPLSTGTGIGQETNRATLGHQIKILMSRVRDDQEKFAQTFNTQVFARWAKSHGYENVPKLVFNEPDLEETDLALKRISDLVKNEIIALDDKDLEKIRKKVGLGE